MSNSNNYPYSANLAAGQHPVNTMPAVATTDSFGQNQIPVSRLPNQQVPLANSQAFLVQNHPDTVNNMGTGHNVNAGRIQVASLDPTANTTMNANPSADNLSHIAKERYTIPNAPNMGNDKNNNNNNSNTMYDQTDSNRDKNMKSDSNKKKNNEPVYGYTNIVGNQAIATHLAGNPSMNTNTSIQNNSTGNMGAANKGETMGLAKNANIGDEINTNPVATNHPHANTPGGDIHTNQLLNQGVLLHDKAGVDTVHHTNSTTGSKHRNDTDTTLDKERMEYH